MISETTSEKLKSVGVHIHSGGFSTNLIMSPLMVHPLVAIWYESEEPTEEEIKQLQTLLKNQLKGWNPTYVKDFCVEGANTLTLTKKNGHWKYRRLTWQCGGFFPYYPNKGESLTELIKTIIGEFEVD